MTPEVQVGNHQSSVSLPMAWLTRLEREGSRAAERILAAHLAEAGAPLEGLEEVEVALVDDEASERVHRDFMGIDGATDVITFEHGEIVIGVEVAQAQAAEYGEPLERELFRYLVHGLLHLAGHEDESDDDRERMEAVQEALVRELWGSAE